MKNNKAFTIIEIFTIIAIISILSAMAISWFQQVRLNSVIQMVEKGQKLEPNQREIYQEYLRDKKKKGEQIEYVLPQVSESSEQTTLNVVSYRVIKKEEIKEVLINGEVFCLIQEKEP